MKDRLHNAPRERTVGHGRAVCIIGPVRGRQPRLRCEDEHAVATQADAALHVDRSQRARLESGRIRDVPTRVDKEGLGRTV
eukprot:2383128-Rhodomonas_salina.1